MSSRPIDADDDGIGPDRDVAEVRLPPHVGERLATLYGRDDRFETAGEWLGAMRPAVREEVDGAATEADLCHADDGAHAIEIDGDDASFVCVLDPLVVPFLRDRPGTVRSETPLAGEEVVLDVGPDGVDATPEAAVISIGVARDVAADEPATIERTYATVCPYVHAFGSPAEYERWADEVDASTTSVSVETGLAVARGIATELFDADAN